MALRLRVVSEHADRLGNQASKVFSVHGGTIGRGNDNAWILPDPERYLSGKHARVDFRAGTYVLVDTSSNGTFVNGAQVPLGKYHDYTLKDGDYIRIGEYEMLVNIDQSNDFPPDESAISAFDGGPASAALKKATANDIGVDLNLSDLLEPSGSGDFGLAPSAASAPRGPSPASAQARNVYGQPVGAAAAGDTDGEVPWHMMTRPLKVDRDPPVPAPVPAPVSAPPSALALAAPRGQQPQFYDGDSDAGLSAFCRGAGIDPRRVGSEARNNALQLAGQLLREAVLGVMDLNQTRAEFRNRFRMPAAAEEVNESSWNFHDGVDETLVRLLTTQSTRAGSVEAMRDNFRDLKAQQAATFVAMQTALMELLERFEPGQLAERFERGAKRSVFGAPNKGRYWDLYGELFTSLAQAPAGGFPHLFVEAFAKAYEAKLRSLAPARRGPFAGDEPYGGDEPDGSPDRIASSDH
jgi:type VI secretion system protein